MRDMASPSVNPAVRLLPSMTDVAFLMPAAFLFLRMEGATTMLGDGDTGWHVRTGEGPVDVPLFADVSRVHAALTRDAECYLLEAGKAVELNGVSAERAVLQSADRIALGSACHLTFDLPVPGCLSARLLLSGGRRLPMAVDGVLLMADMLVLGPGVKTHVQLPDLEKPLYLIRQKDDLIVKWDGEFRVEGVKYEGKAPLPRAGSVVADPFAFAIEPV